MTEAAPKSPRAVLVELLTQAPVLDRARAAGPILWPQAAPDVAFVKATFALAGWPAPPGEGLSEFVGALCAWGFAAVPAPLGPPQPGDLFVSTHPETRVPVGLGFTAGAVSRDGLWFQAIGADGVTRTALTSVDFWLKIPGG